MHKRAGSVDDSPSLGKVQRRWLVGALVAVVVGVVIVGLVWAFNRSEAVPSAGGSTSTATVEPSRPAERPEGNVVSPTPVAGAPDGASPELAPVPVDDVVEADGLVVALTRFESVQGEAEGPGEVVGPAVRVTLSITNDTSEDFDLQYVVLNGYMGDQRDPAEIYEKPGGAPLSGVLQPGQTAEGVYLFRIPEDRRDDVTFVVDYRTGSSAVVFRGSVQ